jgi:hypothetical protein
MKDDARKKKANALIERLLEGDGQPGYDVPPEGSEEGEGDLTVTLTPEEADLVCEALESYSSLDNPEVGARISEILHKFHPESEPSESDDIDRAE